MIHPPRDELPIERQAGHQQHGGGGHGVWSAQAPRQDQGREHRRRNPQQRPQETGGELRTRPAEQRLEEQDQAGDAAIDQARPVHERAHGRLQPRHARIVPAAAVGQVLHQGHAHGVVGVAQRVGQTRPVDQAQDQGHQQADRQGGPQHAPQGTQVGDGCLEHRQIMANARLQRLKPCLDPNYREIRR